ncbi:hypothetical protein JCM16418A_07770 [Paenibacillus pini]
MGSRDMFSSEEVESARHIRNDYAHRVRRIRSFNSVRRHREYTNVMSHYRKIKDNIKEIIYER